MVGFLLSKISFLYHIASYYFYKNKFGSNKNLYYLCSVESKTTTALNMNEYSIEIQEAAKFIMNKADECKPSIKLTDKELKALEFDEEFEDVVHLNEVVSPERMDILNEDYRKYCQIISDKLSITIDDAMKVCSTVWWEGNFGEGFPYYGELMSICSDLTRIQTKVENTGK